MSAVATGAGRRRMLLLLVAGVLVFTAGGIAVWRGLQTSTSGPSDSEVAVSQVQEVTITEGQPIVLGRADARATVSVYTDFHCTACAEVQDRFRDTLVTAERAGRVRLEIYPIAAVDPGSATAANALACAAEAGGAESYYLGLFATPEQRWTSSNLVELGNNSALVPGREADFETCVTGQEHAAWVGSINLIAEANGVAGTPTMLLDGSPLDLTSLTPEILSGMIEEANR